MSHTQTPHSPNIPYDLLPLAHDPRDTVYRDTPSPRTSSFEMTPVEPTTFPEGMPQDTTPPRLPPGARFLQGDFEYRNSLVSHNTFYSAPSAPNSSVYALQPDSASAEFVGYQDDPGIATRNPVESNRYLEEKRSAYSSLRSKSKRGIIILASIAAAIIVIVAVVLAVYFTVIKPKSNNVAASPASTTSTGTGNGSGSVAVVTGGNGSTITTENGTTFTYVNPFGGTWYWDPNDPFNNNAQANSWTPPLNQTFKFGTNRMFGSVIFDDVSFSPPDNHLPL